MLQTVENLWSTKELTGECLLAPLKEYQSYFGRKVAENEESSDTLKAVSWRIAQFILGIFAYPIFGLLALIGMGIKLTGVPGLIKHNSEAKVSIAFACRLPDDSTEGRGGCGYGGMKVPLDLLTKYAYRLTIDDSRESQEAISQEARNKIDSFSWEFKKVYVYTSGQINQDGTGFLKIELQTE